jgi:hypothetical protein
MGVKVEIPCLRARLIYGLANFIFKPFRSNLAYPLHERVRNKIIFTLTCGRKSLQLLQPMVYALYSKSIGQELTLFVNFKFHPKPFRSNLASPFLVEPC